MVESGCQSETVTLIGGGLFVLACLFVCLQSALLVLTVKRLRALGLVLSDICASKIQHGAPHPSDNARSVSTLDE